MQSQQSKLNKDLQTLKNKLIHFVNNQAIWLFRDILCKVPNRMANSLDASHNPYLLQREHNYGRDGSKFAPEAQMLYVPNNLFKNKCSICTRCGWYVF